MKFCLLVAACLCANGFCSLHAQTLEVSPNHVLLDETAAIRANGLRPHELVTIEATLVDGAERRWTSQAEFLADAQGAVDVSRQAPVKGSYDEVSAMGLIWSMKPDEKHVDQYSSPGDLGIQIIQFRLIEAGKQVASAQLEQRNVAEGVHQIKVEGQLHGVLFVPGTNGRHPGVLVGGDRRAASRSRKRHGWRRVDSPHSLWPTFAMKTYRQTWKRFRWITSAVPSPG